MSQRGNPPIPERLAEWLRRRVLMGIDIMDNQRRNCIHAVLIRNKKIRDAHGNGVPLYYGPSRTTRKATKRTFVPSSKSHWLPGVNETFGEAFIAVEHGRVRRGDRCSQRILKRSSRALGTSLSSLYAGELGTAQMMAARRSKGQLLVLLSP